MATTVRFFTGRDTVDGLETEKEKILNAPSGLVLSPVDSDGLHDIDGDKEEGTVIVPVIQGHGVESLFSLKTAYSGNVKGRIRNKAEGEDWYYYDENAGAWGVSSDDWNEPEVIDRFIGDFFDGFGVNLEIELKLTPPEAQVDLIACVYDYDIDPVVDVSRAVSKHLRKSLPTRVRIPSSMSNPVDTFDFDPEKSGFEIEEPIKVYPKVAPGMYGSDVFDYLDGNTLFLTEQIDGGFLIEVSTADIPVTVISRDEEYFEAELPSIVIQRPSLQYGVDGTKTGRDKFKEVNKEKKLSRTRDLSYNWFEAEFDIIVQGERHQEADSLADFVKQALSKGELVNSWYTPEQYQAIGDPEITVTVDDEVNHSARTLNAIVRGKVDVSDVEDELPLVEELVLVVKQNNAKEVLKIE